MSSNSETQVKSSIATAASASAAPLKSQSTTSSCSTTLDKLLSNFYNFMCSSTIIKQDGLCPPATAYGRLATDVSDSTSKENLNMQQLNDTTMNNTNTTTKMNYTATLKSLLLVIFISIFVLEFSHFFPFVIPGVISAAKATYIPAWYQYDTTHTKFDNTPWTYNTDYILTAVMSILAIKCLTARAANNDPHCMLKNANSLKLRLYSASLLICYGISTLVGGYAHQNFTSIDMLNTFKFRMFWFVCVGNVAFASCYMGLIGREVQRIFGVEGMVPLGPWWFWPVYGTYMSAACAFGYISFKRPACDIFIAGITQFPTTFYCLAALGLRRWPRKKSTQMGNSVTPKEESPIDLVRLPYRLMYYIGFIGNAPLLPMYPALVQYSGMSLAGVNTLLHSWLMVMWGMQGISLLHLCKAMSLYKPKSSQD